MKGNLGFWLRLAERAAFRKGISTYCGHKNPVEPGMWSGGIVGLKKILGVRSRERALQVLDTLQDMGYISYTLEDTKQLTYRITDWVEECSGEECMEGTVYTTPGYGFLCMPRNITERLVEQGRVFEEADAWLDLWCHTVFRDKGNAFSFLSPVVQYGKYGSMLTLETLGKRWGWEKTKVWRFFRKFAPYFQLYRLPSSYGCVIFSQFYPVCEQIEMPEEDAVMSIFRNIRIWFSIYMLFGGPKLIGQCRRLTENYLPQKFVAPTLYGGSMNDKNAFELLAQPDIDGGLIGGASLVPEKFVKIIEAANQPAV